MGGRPLSRQARAHWNDARVNAFGHQTLNEGNRTMLIIQGTIPVRTRLPLAAWAVAGVVALFSVASSLMHASVPSSPAMPTAEQGAQSQGGFRQAKL